MVCERPHPTQSPGHGRTRRRGFTLCAAALITLLGASRWRFHRVVVSGESMRPAFEPGDRVLVVPAVCVRPGHVVAIRDPRRPDRLLVKRVRSIASGLVDVRGDNQGASTDSRDFGPVPRSSVAGRVVYRYGPPERVGRLPG
jgi:nickel-type superoxide dismutase maturation protease